MSSWPRVWKACRLDGRRRWTPWRGRGTARPSRTGRGWQRQQAQHFVENVYNPAMDAFLAVIRMAVGASAALDSHMLTAIGRDTVLRDPSNWDKNPASARRTGSQSDPRYLRLSELAALVRPHLGKDLTEPPQEDSGAAA